MVNNEVRFAQILEEIKYTARIQGGYISKEDIEASFEELELDSKQFELVFDYLKSSNIGVDKPLEQTEYLSESEIDILGEYKSELDELEKISDGEKRVFIMEAMQGDAIAQTKLINHYLPQVLEISRLYASQGVNIEDLIGEGNLAIAEGVTMLGALEEPEEADGMIAKLIMDAMEALIAENISESTKDQKIADKVNKVADKAQELAEAYGRKITVEELADNSNLSKKAILEAVRMSGNKIEDIDYKEVENA